MISTPTDSRQRLQISLRAFLVLISVAAVGLASFGSIVQRRLEQRRAVLEIVKMGGLVTFRDPSNLVQRNEWLRRVVGDEALHDILSVDLSGSEMSGEDLAQLRGLINLRSIVLGNSQVTTTSLTQLNEMTQLNALDLSGTSITDEGLAQLSGLKYLGWLYLSDTLVTDEGLDHLKGMTRLQELLIEHTLATKRGVIELKSSIPGCKIFWRPKLDVGTIESHSQSEGATSHIN